MTTEHREYMRHVRACRVAGAGHRCLVCLDLLRSADAADWRPSLAQARAERTVGAPA
jgi:hypothetical protein